MRRLTPPDRLQLVIARQTLRMNPAMARVMGGPSITEAWHTVYRLTGRWPTEAEVHADTWAYNRRTGGRLPGSES